jgi:hypothetical protein
MKSGYKGSQNTNRKKKELIMRTDEFNEVLKSVLEARAAKKASLKGIERMRYNLYHKVYPWALKETDYRCICVAEIAEKVAKYAPKTIRVSRPEMEKAIDEIWAGVHGYSLYDEEWLRESLDFEMDCMFNRTKAA